LPPEVVVWGREIHSRPPYKVVIGDRIEYFRLLEKVLALDTIRADRTLNCLVSGHDNVTRFTNSICIEILAIVVASG